MYENGRNYSLLNKFNVRTLYDYETDHPMSIEFMPSYVLVVTMRFEVIIFFSIYAQSRISRVGHTLRTICVWRKVGVDTVPL